MNRLERRATVARALTQVGDALNLSAFARQLGVSRSTVWRDVRAIRAGVLDAQGLLNAVEMPEHEPTALPPIINEGDPQAQRAGVAAALLDVEQEAKAQYSALVDRKPEHASTASLLRVRLDALNKYVHLNGLERTLNADAERQPEGPSKIILKWEDDEPEW